MHSNGERADRSRTCVSSALFPPLRAGSRIPIAGVTPADRSTVSGVDIRASKRLGTLCIRSVRIADASRLATSRVDNPGTKRREMLCIRTVSVGASRATGLTQYGFAVCDDGFECRPPAAGRRSRDARLHTRLGCAPRCGYPAAETTRSAVLFNGERRRSID